MLSTQFGSALCAFARSATRLAVIVGLFATAITVAGPDASAAPPVARCAIVPVAGASQTNYRVSWSPVAEVDAEVGPSYRGGYVIERRVGDSPTWHWRQRVNPGNSNWFDDLTGGAGTTPSTYRVITKDAAGVFSDPVTCATAVGDTRRPSKPGPIEATATSSSLALTWGASSDNVGVVGYEVTANGETTTVVGTSATIAGLRADRRYAVRVKAVDAAGNTSGGRWATLRTVDSGDRTRPTRPTRPKISDVTDTTANVSWRAATDDVAILDYTVYFDSDGVSPNDSPQVVAAETTGLSVTLTDLEPGSTYYVYVRARDTSGNRSFRSGYRTIETTGGDSCDPTRGTATGRWHTELVCGDIWHIINPAGAVDNWNAINVRADRTADHPISAADIAQIGDHFDTVRFALRWSQMQPDGPNQLDAAWVGRVRTMLNNFAAEDIDVVLDVAHLGGDPGREAFGIPSWAWETAGVSVSRRTANLSFNAWAGADRQGANTKRYLDQLDNAGLLTHPAVIAVEVMNEPHPPVGLRATSFEGQEALAEVYNELISHIRTKDSDMLAVIGAYYGGTRHGGKRTNDTFEHIGAMDAVTNDNVVWTAHNYFTGAGDDDGQSDEGNRGAGVWTEGHESGGCYGGRAVSNRSVEWNCPATPDDRSSLQVAIKENARGQWEFAQLASMPFFMGEWGVGRQRYQSGEYRGWGLSEYFFCDKIAAYSNVDGTGTGISWAVWSFDAGTDAYGLFYARDSREPAQSHRSYLTPNTWANGGVFGAESQGWEGESWSFAEPFTQPGFCNSL